MKKIKLIILAFSCLIIAAQGKYENILKQTDIKRVKTNLEYLASDELKGRDAISKEELISAEYIIEQFKSAGIKPFGDNAGYLQKFREKTSNISTKSTITLEGATRFKEYRFLTEFLYQGSSGNNIEEKEIVFCGYGINTEDGNYNSYKDIDLKGKIVILVGGKPANLDGEKYSHFISPQNKVMNSLKTGAAGVVCFLPDNKEEEKYWPMLEQESASTKIENGEMMSNMKFNFCLFRFNELKSFLDNENIDADAFVQAIKDGEDVPSIILKKKIKYNITCSNNEVELHNVVGIIEGSDDKLKNEYVTLTAHYDHEGVRNNQVYNGADDNGSGTVAVIELARILKDSKPKRSLIFALFTAEEKGLIGSKYFTANHPSIQNTFANINFDMVAKGNIDTLHCIGADKISDKFAEIVNIANKESANYVLETKFDDLNKSMLFYQSDHYSFYEKMIPSVFFFDNDLVDLHKPSDDTDKINYNKLEKSIKLGAATALEAANYEGTLK